MRKTQLGIIGSIFVAFALGSFFYPQLPQEMAVHWGLEGQANGYAQKEWGVFGVPALMAAIAILFAAIPKIDPLRKNIGKFLGHYYGFALAIEVFMLYVYALTIAWNLGFLFNFSQALSPAFAFLFYCMGVLVGIAEPNWSVGIRTPWTLSSKRVWKKTHKLGAKLFKAGAAFALLGVLLPQVAIVLVIVPVLLGSLFLVAYSYFEYRKEGKEK